MNTFFLKGRSLAFQTVVELDGQDGNDISHKFLGAFEVIAFHTFLDYENFYLWTCDHNPKYYIPDFLQ